MLHPDFCGGRLWVTMSADLTHTPLLVCVWGGVLPALYMKKAEVGKEGATSQWHGSSIFLHLSLGLSLD